MAKPSVRLLTVFASLERTHALGRMLTLLGYEVLGAPDLSSAGLLALHTRPAALLVDAALPPAATLGRLREYAPQAPILAVDALDSAAVARTWLDVGAAVYTATLPSSAPLEQALALLCPLRPGGASPSPWAVVGLMAALEAHDPSGAGHARSVARLTIEIARRFGLDRDSIRQAGWGALLHEVGRLALPREALGPLYQLTASQRHLRGQIPRLSLHVAGALPLGSLAGVVIGSDCSPEAWVSTAEPATLARRIMGVADAFDSLARDYPRLPPADILAYLEMRHGWDRTILAALRAVLAAEAANLVPGRAVGATLAPSPI